MNRWGLSRLADMPASVLANARLVGACSLGLQLVACTPFQDGDDVRQQQLQQLPQLEEASSTESLGMDGEGSAELEPWGCLDELTATGEDVAVGAGQGDLVTLRVPFHNYATQQPVTDVEVRVCINSDINCNEPLQDFQPVLPTGVFAALVPWGFSGYLEVRGPSVLPVVVMVDTVVYRNLELYSHGLLPLEAYAQFAQALQVGQDEGLGLFLAIARDCYGQEAVGVTLELSAGPNAVAYGTAQGVPSTGVTSTGREGSFGYANVTPGLSRIIARTPGGEVFDEQGAVLRAGVMTVMTARPRVYSAEEMCPVAGTPLVPGTRAAVGQMLPCTLL